MEEDIEKGRRQCLCWTARECLLVWSGLSVLSSVILLVSFYLGNYYNSQHGILVVSLITVILNICVSSFEFIAVLSRSIKLLFYSFYSVCAYVIYIVVAMLITIMIMTGMFGTPAVQLDSNLQKFLVVILNIVYSSILIVVQVFLGWSVREAWKDTVSRSKNKNASLPL